MIERWCDLNGPLMRFRAEADALLAPAFEGWVLPETTPGDRADFTVDVRYAAFAAAPADAPLLFEGVTPPDLHCVVRQVGDCEHYAIDRRATLVLGARTGVLRVCPGEEKLVRSGIAFQTIGAALTLGDQLVLHAAALELPASKAAVLIFGPSGFGKSTTTLSLMAAGWSLLSDDISVIKRAAGTDRVWGLPLGLKVHRNTAALLPWLRPLMTDAWNLEQEQSLSVDKLSDFLGVTPADHDPREVSAIVVLTGRNPERHRFHPLAKSDSFRAIVADNISRNLLGIGARQQVRLGRITELVRNAPPFGLSAGPDLQSLSPAILVGLDRSD